jgi:anthranilate phosphoribosyltransferase
MTENLVARLLDRRPLSGPEAVSAFQRLLAPETPEPERGGLLVALEARPRSTEELTAFAREMRRRATAFDIPEGDRPIDLCGSGGAATPSFNVSTVSAFVVAAAGVPVVKHGNRSSSGICGSSDLLEALGLPVTTSVGFAQATYRARRLAFLHAPLYHPAAKAVAPARKALGIPTIFNRLGPLCNPANVPYQLAGAPTPELAKTFADVLGQLGVARGVSMASDDGCDEFSPQVRTTAYVWNGGTPRVRYIRPEAHLGPKERLGSWGALPPARAAEEAERLLRGGEGARRGAILLTSGTALWLTGDEPTLTDGVEKARSTLDSGDAAELLAELRELAPRFRGEGS